MFVVLQYMILNLLSLRNMYGKVLLYFLKVPFVLCPKPLQLQQSYTCSSLYHS